MAESALLSSLERYDSKPSMHVFIGRIAYRSLILLLLVVQGGPTGVTAQTPPSPIFQEHQILDARTGQPVAFEDFLTVLAAQDVVYVGEEHQNRWHVEAAVKMLDGLLARQRQPVIALEMFSWDGQGGLDRYLSGQELSRADFLRDSHWEENWGGGFENYEPLVAFARSRHLPVQALNPPRSLVRLVAGKGMAQAMMASEMERWGMKHETFPEIAAYHDMIVQPLRQCHGGMSDQGYQRMYEAAVFRDESMAKAVVDRLSRIRAVQRSPTSPADTRPGPVVSYTGGGHIQYYLPVPDRVLRRVGSPIRQVSVYLAAFDPDRAQEVREYLQKNIADYVWLTPLGAHGTPRRCK